MSLQNFFTLFFFNKYFGLILHESKKGKKKGLATDECSYVNGRMVRPYVSSVDAEALEPYLCFPD